MPAKSKAQRKLFGLALSVKRGDTPRSEVDQQVLDIVDRMSEDKIKEYAQKNEQYSPSFKEFLGIANLGEHRNRSKQTE